MSTKMGTETLNDLFGVPQEKVDEMLRTIYDEVKRHKAPNTNLLISHLVNHLLERYPAEEPKAVVFMGILVQRTIDTMFVQMRAKPLFKK